MIKHKIDSPFSNGKAALHKEKREMNFRGEQFSYLHCNYRCQDTGTEFTTDDMDFDNLERIYVQYRAKHDIPSPDEIRETRERYGLSAAKMSEILGLGANQYRLYEDGEMPSLAIGKMLRRIQTPAVFLSYVESCKNEMSEQDYNKLCRKIEKTITKDIKEKPNFQWLHEMFAFGNNVIGKVAL